MFSRLWADALKTLEDAVFIYYGCPNQRWQDKCQKCRNQVLNPRSHAAKPIRECINCWKVEIWSKSLTTPESHQSLEDLLTRLLGLLQDADWPYGFCAKISKAPIQVVRTGIPKNAYPPHNLDYLLMLYAETIRQKDLLLRAIDRVLAESGGPESIVIPVRRGCWLYDDILGPWTTWYPLDSDYPDT